MGFIVLGEALGAYVYPATVGPRVTGEEVGLAVAKHTLQLPKEAAPNGSGARVYPLDAVQLT